MELYSDTYYVQRIQAGHTADFACLLDKYSRSVYALIFKLLRNKEDAEELTQDVFMKVFRHLNSFNGDSSLSTWIYRIAWNTAISEIRKKKHVFPTIDEARIDNVSEENLSGVYAPGNEDERLKHLEIALTQLPPDEQAIILFFYMEEKSVNEIASITGLSASNVKTKMHRIRKKLWVLLKEMEEDTE
jgi:RNA polymerase sigma-70 factor (ECF subfamily)